MQRDVLLHEVTGRGDPIVLVPGGISGWLSWIPHAERLSSDRTVVRVQLRSVQIAEAGEPYPPDYGIVAEREALRATVDQLGLQSFDLAGWSYGGLVALAFALEYPSRVRTITLIEPDAPWLLRQTGYDPDSLAEVEAHERSMSGRDVTIEDLKEFLVGAGLSQPGENVESEPGWPIWSRNRQVLSIVGKAWDYDDSIERLRSFDVPLLGVKGTDTNPVLAEIVDRLVAAAPRSRLLELPGDHACHIQNLDRFLEELYLHTGSVPEETASKEASHA